MSKKTKVKSKPIPKGSPSPVKEEKVEKEKVAKEEKVEVVKEPTKEVKAEPKKKTRARAKTIDIEPNELVSVRSVTKGLLIYVSSRTGQTIRWNDFGAVEYVEFGELVTMKSSSPRFMNEPFLVVDDEDVAEKLGLSDLYKTMIDVDDLEDFFKQSLDSMKEQIEKMPKGNKNLIGDTAHEMVKEGKLYDIRKIKLLEQELGIGLQISMD